MFYEINKKPSRENAALVGLVMGDTDRITVDDHLDELSLLTKTAGGREISRYIQARGRPDSSTYIGRGKLKEIRDNVEAQHIDVVIFDDELSPAQVQHIQECLRVKVIDRTNLILDIFARNARTRESRIQVELAQLKYIYPRLTRAWSHFGQQTGGIGTRGPGETQLETDRRMIQRKISDLNRRLKKIEKQQAEQRKNRAGIFKICLAGYTNAGKSTILNALTNEKIKEADMLFSTLDTTMRRLYLQDFGNVLLSDTVGFIRKLPAHLVNSFRSTLHVIREADMLLHVVDIGETNPDLHIETVIDTLKELGAEETPRILVFNKVDMLHSEALLEKTIRNYPESVQISAKNSGSLRKLKNRIMQSVRRIRPPEIKQTVS